MFEVIIGCTFVLWCVFGGILLKYKKAELCDIILLWKTKYHQAQNK